MIVKLVFIDICILTLVCEGVHCILKFATQGLFPFRPLYFFQPSHTIWHISAIVKSFKHCRSNFFDNIYELIHCSQAVKKIKLWCQASYLEEFVIHCHSDLLIFIVYWHTVIRN